MGTTLARSIGLTLQLLALLVSGEVAKFNTSSPMLPPKDAVQRLTNITGNVANCKNGTKFYPQAVEHATFDGNYNDKDATFPHQYSVLDKYYKPGGPILFFQDMENPKMTCIENLSMEDWAEKLGALAISLEHRYFGLSIPYGLNYTEYPKWSPGVYKHLTLENVLRDGVSLVNYIKNAAYPASKDAKVYVISGSYGGVLSLLYRQHYHKYIDGVISLSPITTGLISDPNDPLTYSWGEWGSMYIRDHSPKGANMITEGFAQIREAMEKGNSATVKKSLSLCTKPMKNQTTELLQNLMANILVSMQMNWARNGRPLNQVLYNLEKAGSPVTAVADAVNVQTIINGGACLDWRAPYQLGGPFLWLRCTQIPYPDPFSTSDSIFGPILPDKSKKHLLDPFCQPSFGIDSIEGGAELHRRLMLDNASLKNATRLVVGQGLQDPGTALGPSSWFSGSGFDTSRNMYISDTCHVEPGYRADPADSPATSYAREALFNYLKAWSGISEAKKS